MLGYQSRLPLLTLKWKVRKSGDGRKQAAEVEAAWGQEPRGLAVTTLKSWRQETVEVTSKSPQCPHVCAKLTDREVVVMQELYPALEWEMAMSFYPYPPHPALCVGLWN